MVYKGIDLASCPDKSVVVIPDDADVFKINGQIVIMHRGARESYPEGTIVFSQSGLKNACDWGENLKNPRKNK